MPGEKPTSSNGQRSAGVAYVDLAVGDSQALVAGVAKAGSSAAEAFLKVFQEAFKPAGITDELQNEIVKGSSEAAKAAVKEVNDALRGAQYTQLELFDTAAMVEQAAKAGTEAGKALATPIEDAGQQAGKAAGTSVGDGVATGAEEGSKKAGDSIRQNISSSAKSAGDDSKNRILSAFDELKHGITYSIGGWGIGYSIGNALYSGFNSAFSAIKDTIFGFNSEVQQAQIALTTMLGSSSAATSFDKQLQQFAVKTPFEYSTLVPDAQKMMALGIPQQQIIPTLTAIGDAVSSMGGSPQTLEETVNAVSELASKGQVMEVNLRQLEIRGIPALRILADEYHVSAQKMQEMIRAGTVMSSDALPKLVDGIEHGTKSTHKLGGEMALQAGTFEGSLSNIHDALQQFGGEAFKPIFDALNKLAVRWADWLGNDHSNLIAKIKSDTQEFVSGAESFVKGAIRLGDIATSGLSKPIEEFLKPVFDDVVKGASAVEDWLPKLAHDFNDIAKALLTVGKDVGLDVWRVMGGAIAVVAPLVKDLADALAAIARNRTVVAVAKDLLEVFLAYKTAMFLKGFITDLYENISSRLVPAIYIWKTAQTEATTAMAATSVEASATQTAMAGIVGGAKGAATGFGALLSGLNPVTLGLTAVTLAAGYFINKAVEEKQTADNLVSSLMNLGDAYKRTHDLTSQGVQDAIMQNQQLKELTNNSDKYGVIISDVTKAASGDAAAQRDVIAALKQKADLVAADARAQADIVRQTRDTQGEAAKKLDADNKQIDQINAMTDGLKKQFGQMASNDAAARQLAEAQGLIGANGKVLSQSDQDLIKKLEDLRKGNLNAADASDALKAAQDRLNGNKVSLLEADQNLAQAKLSLTQALKDNKYAFDENSQAGISDRQQLLAALKASRDYYDAQVAAKGPSDALTKAYKDQVQSLIDQVPKIDQNKDLIGQLTDAYKHVPDTIDTEIQLRGYTDATGQLSALGQHIADMVRQFGVDPQIAINLATSIGQNKAHDTAARAKLLGYTHADGGPISGPGTGTSDSIPAMLSNGEHVWTAAEVTAAGGHSAVEALRQSVLQGFAAGGAVHHRIGHAMGGHHHYLHRALTHHPHHAYGAHHNVHAHHRSVHVPHPNAHHSRPLAHHHHVMHHLRKFAQGGPVLGINTSANITDFPAYQFSRNVFEGMQNQLQGVLDAGGGGQLGAWIAAGLAAAGVPLSWASGMRALIGRESGGNPRAINLTDQNAAAGHPSMGIAQTIMPTFEAYRVPGLPDDPFNPVSDIAAAARYIRAVYGDISNVQQANPNLPPMGYDNGGWMMPGVPGMNGLRKPEPVFNPTQWNIMSRLVQRGVDSSGSKQTVVHVYFDGKLVDDRVEVKVEEAFDDLTLALSGGRKY